MKLTTEDLREVRRLLFPARRKWYHIGVELKLKIEELDTIKARCNSDPNECLIEMLEVWLKSTDSSPTWKALGDALKAEPVDEVKLAQKAYSSDDSLLSSADTVSTNRELSQSAPQTDQGTQTSANQSQQEEEAVTSLESKSRDTAHQYPSASPPYEMFGMDTGPNPTEGNSSSCSSRDISTALQIKFSSTHMISPSAMSEISEPGSGYSSSPPPATLQVRVPHLAHYTRKTGLQSKLTNSYQEGGIKLWQFLYSLLTNPEKKYKDIIEWTAKAHEKEFRILEPESIAIWWGHHKNKPSMTYDKFSRSLHYYYAKGILNKTLGDRYVYRFLIDPELMYRHIGTSDCRPKVKPMPQAAKTAMSKFHKTQNIDLKPEDIVTPEPETLEKSVNKISSARTPAVQNTKAGAWMPSPSSKHSLEISSSSLPSMGNLSLKQSACLSETEATPISDPNFKPV